MKTILLADDDVTLRELARLTMNDPEYCILEAGDGVEALDLARTKQPDLLILDWMMPTLEWHRCSPQPASRPGNRQHSSYYADCKRSRKRQGVRSRGRCP